MKMKHIRILALSGIFALASVTGVQATADTDGAVIIDESDWDIDENEEEEAGGDTSGTDTTDTGSSDTDDSTTDTGSSASDTTSSAGGSAGSDSGTGSSTGSGSSGTSSSSSSSASSSSASSTSSRSTNSSDSSLKRLSINPGELVPTFSASVFSYEAYVDEGVTAISVGANPNDPGAVIASVSGAKSITPGTNTVTVVVEAADRSTSTYTITVHCGENGAEAATADEGETSDAGLEDDIAQSDETEASESDGTDLFDTPSSTAIDVEIEDDGTLYYDGVAYVPADSVEEVISVEKYNTLNDKYKAAKDKFVAAVMIGVIVCAILLIILINVILKYKLGDDDAPVKEKTKKEKPVKERPVKEKQVKEKPAKEKTVREKPAKEKSVKERSEKKMKSKEPMTGANEEEIEIMDLEDL